MTDDAAPPRAERPTDVPPPPPPRGRDQTVWVGLFLVLGLAATLTALLVLTDAAIFRGRYIVTTRVDNAGGIRKGDPVLMRGVSIGRVQRFEISGEGVAIRLEIDGEYAIPADSRVLLRSGGFLGGLYADVVPGSSAKVLGYGDTLPGSREDTLMDTTNRLASQTETILGRVESLLSPETIGDVKGSAADLQALLRQLSATVTEQRRELSGLVASLRRSSDGLERVATSPELERAVKRLDSLTERIEGVTGSLDRSSQSVEAVLARIERGEGTLGKLATDDALYDEALRLTRDLSGTLVDLDRALLSVDRLTQDIQKNPKRYLRLSLF
jgi:phospholipid/cholesterol/gamma-HCH transport system substrate-binding protein